MGASLWLAEERGEDGGGAKRASRFLFGAAFAQRVVHVRVLRAPALGRAFVEVVVLLAAVAATAASFSKVSKTAALLLVPYLL